MRIDRLELAAYGPFTGVEIELARSAGLHVVFGPNEAGKSSALRAISDLFFGVPLQTSDNFLHPYDALNIRATISGRKGTLEFVRRKRKSGSDLFDAFGGVLARDVLVPFLGHADRSFFEHAFGLDPDRLAEGAMDLLQSGGDVGRAVLQASSGVSGLSARLDAIEAEAGDLFKKGGKTQAVNACLSRLKALEDEMKASRLSSETWKGLSDELASVSSEAERLVAQRAGTEVDRQRLTRIQRALPLLARRNAWEAVLTRLVGVPLLPDAFDGMATSARDERLRAVTAEESLAREVSSLEADLSRLPAPGALLLRGKEIEALHQECGAMRGFRTDLPAREGELREATAHATRLAGQIAPGAGVDEVIATLLPGPARKALRASAAEASHLRDGLSREERDLAAIREGIRISKEELAALGPAVDPAPLARAIREVERRGDPVERLSKANSAVRKSRKMLDDSLASLSGWAPRGADELAALSLPGDATIDSFQERFAALEQDERQMESERKRLSSERETREAERRTLAAGRTLPTRQDVVAARERRTTGWKLVRRVYVQGEPDAGNEAKVFDPDRPLADAFERSMDSADGASDRLVDAANDAARDAELARQLQGIEAKLAEGAKCADALASGRTAIEAEWRSAWPDAGIAPRMPTEMKEWLRARARALERLEAHRTAEADAETEREALERARASLIGALAAVCLEGVAPSVPYAEVHSLAEVAREKYEKAAAERKRRELSIEDATLKIGTLEVSTAQARENLKAWKSAWAEGVEAVRRPATVSTDEVVAILDGCDELDKIAPTVSTLRDRIRKMQNNFEEFGSRVASVCAAVAPDVAAIALVTAAETLFERLGVERAAEGKRMQAAENFEKSRGKLAKECEKAKAAHQEVEARCREAACTTVEELPSRLEELKEKRRARQDLDQIQKELLAAGAGRSPDELADECAGIDGDSIPTTLKQLDSERGRLDDAIGNLRRREGELGKSLEAADGGDTAAARRQESEGVRARIEEDARRWLRLRASAFLLKHAIESWRRENQDPLLVEATKIFFSLTEGRFISLLAEVDDDETPVIVAVRAEGKHVRMEGLSDGTRNQLFLALRLAFIRRYARDAEPLPFIADDLLVSFDDARAAAALKVLADFGKEVQVILFTHHRHLVDLTKATLAPAAFELHELDAWAPRQGRHLVPVPITSSTTSTR